MNRKFSLLWFFLSLILLGMTIHSASAACRSDIVASTPVEDFNLHNDGTVTHNTTGLMWMRCSMGQSWDGSTCTGNSSSFTFANALTSAQNFSFAGYSDWRLPNKNELASLMERRCVSPAINSLVFPNTPSQYFWSSSVRNYINGQGAFVADFDFGHIFSEYTSIDFKVRLVRAGQ